MSMINIPEQLVFGLDIGTRSVVGTVGYRRNTKDFTVVAQATRFHETRAMLDGQIHDIGRVAETVGEVRRDLERQLNRKLENVCIAAAGRVLKTFQVHTEYELGDELTITDEMIRTMELIGVEKAHSSLREKESESGGYFCVGYSVVKYFLGDIPIGNLEGHKGNRIGADILATFLPQDVIDGLYEATSRAGLNVVNLTLEPIAAINLAIPEKFRLLNLALIDIGAGTSDICITKDGSIIAYGMIPMAGDAFTEAIMRSFLVEFKTAEEIKMSLAAKKKKITYKDIMGLKQTITADAVNKVLAEPMKELTKSITDKIKELNGGKSVSAIFVVGGGGKGPGFTDLLAETAKLAKERVALRGEEVLNDIYFYDETIKKDPILVTPIGICLNYYEQNNNFIFVRVNDELVKLYDNGRLTVLDAALSIGFPNEKLFPARGKALEFTVNGEKRMIRGETGESSTISINGQTASISSPIVQNDEITIKESTAGADAHESADNLSALKKSIIFIVNGKKVSCPRLATCNGVIIPLMYDIKSGDALEVLDYYTVDKLIEYMDVDKEGIVLVNNVIALGDEKIYENFSVDFGIEAQRELAAEGESEVEESPIGTAMNVTINNISVTMLGKSEYTFVDVLDYYPFDTAHPAGDTVVTLINGEKAEFTSPLNDGDRLEIFWQ